MPLPHSNQFSLESFRARAETQCRLEVESNPRNVAALVNLGTLLKVKKEYAEAEVIFRRALNVDPSSTSALINLGCLMQNVKKDFDEAEALYRRALVVSPNDSRALIYLGSLLHFVKGQYGAAEDMYRQALDGESPSKSAFANHGGYMLDRVGGEGANGYASEDSFESAHNHDRLPFFSIAGNGSMSVRQHEERSSRSSFTSSSGSFRQTPPNDAHSSLVDSLQAGAEAACRLELERDPRNLSTLIQLSTVLKVKQDYLGAEDLLRRAVEVDPKSVTALVNLGSLVQNVRRAYTEAEMLYRRALAVKPNDPRALIHLGSLLHLVRGQNSEAEELYRKAVDADPSCLESIHSEIVSLASSPRRSAHSASSRPPFTPQENSNHVSDSPAQRSKGSMSNHSPHENGVAKHAYSVTSSLLSPPSTPSPYKADERHFDSAGAIRSPSPAIATPLPPPPPPPPLPAAAAAAPPPDDDDDGLSDLQRRPSSSSAGNKFLQVVLDAGRERQSNMGRLQSDKFFQVVLEATRAHAKSQNSTPRFLTRFVEKKNWTKRASALVAKNKFSYFRTFVPRAAIQTLMSSTQLTAQSMNSKAEKELEAHLRELVVLMVDISGFTRLSDRFQGLGQEGIDALTTTINNMFSIILDHVDAWGGDVVKFAGDAVIVIWESPPNAMAETVVQAIECARELESKHGYFQVNVPDMMKLAMADQLNRHFATQAAISGAAADVFEPRKELENLEMKRTLRDVTWLKCLSDDEVAQLADSCTFMTFAEGEVLMAQGESSNRLYIVHSGEVKIYVQQPEVVTRDAGTARAGGEERAARARRFGAEISSAKEGQILGEISFLTGQPHTATVVAARNCSVVAITPQAMQPLLKCNSQLFAELTELMQTNLASMPHSAGVTLRIHQSIACGSLWLAHLGGEHVLKPHDYGSRREFVVIGSALLRASEALDEAPVGSLVVSKVAWPAVADRYVAETTKQGNYRLTGVAPRFEGKPLCNTPRAPPAYGDEDTGHIWTQLKLYCHEGARDLQDVAPFAAEVRKMTVLFVRLHLDLERPDHKTVENSHRALLEIQRAIYPRNGTLRQFLQDDKGLVAICIMGMPPFSPHENDPTRGVLAALAIREAVGGLGMQVGIGVTTGTAYSGFVGSIKRREMCAMGSMVNMSARLMCKAGEDILVDLNTHEAATLMVEFRQKEPIVVKGRDEPMEIFSPVAVRSAEDVQRSIIGFVKKEFRVQVVAPKVEAYFSELSTMGFECSWQHIQGVCHNLLEGGNVERSADGRVLEAVTDLTGLEHGMTRHQALSRGNFETLRPYPASHVQMLAKVACLLSHNSFFSLALVRHVYSSTFPNFADLFDVSIGQLVELELIQPASVGALGAFFGGHPSDALWSWARGELLYSICAQVLNFKTKACSHLSRDIFVGTPAGREPAAADFTQAFRDFIEVPSVETGFHNVYTIPIPGFVKTIVTSLLRTYQRIWHRHAAEFFEQSLDQRWTSSHLILAHHWVSAAEYRQTELAYVNSAVHHMQQSAGIAVEHCAYAQAVEMLQRACNMLDLVPAEAGVADRKAELLFEMAPYTLVVYGHGSVEAIAAYQGLSRVMPRNAALDERAVAVLAGTAANLYGKRLFHAGAKLANQILAHPQAGERHLAVGWALLVPALCHNGDLEGAIDCLRRLDAVHAAARRDGAPPPLVNGVYLTVVAAGAWPAALVRRGEPAAAAGKAREVLALAEEYRHPPTLCYVLAGLCKDYYLLVGDLAQCEAVAARAEELALRYQFAHCRRLVSAARHKANLLRGRGSRESNVSAASDTDTL